ncbi:MAG: penicillin-binding protein 6 [Deltaproteobacteria bacterium]|jgi:D-alanyl-D-alanine carboxypeptidase (penicillin-binding protein 5/6)|nr:penicillin-binding protein 6 [Deltaproteobacteria bacterium]
MNRFQKNVWVTLLLVMIVIVMIYPSPILCKTNRVSKTPKTSQKAKIPEKIKTTENKQTPSGSLQCDARAAILMDGLTGQVLFEQNRDLKMSPASFVKVMTLYLVYDAIRAGQLKMDEMVTVSEKAWKMQGSKMFIKVGERVKVEDLIKGVAIASGNDACIALAEHLSGSEEVFVSKMNEKARLLGLKDSQFKNSHGMPAEGQVTTAMEMAILSKRYIEDHAEALVFHSTVEFKYNGIPQENRNTLLRKNIGVDGLKTGHVEEAGFHLAATAKRDGQRMIAVVMGCNKMNKRGPEAQKLLEYGFKNFSTIEAVKKGAAFGPVKVKRGKLNQVGLTAAEDARVTVAKGKESLVSVVPQLPQSVIAPIQKDQVLAKVVIQNEGKITKEVNLLASSAVEKSLIPPWPILAGIVLGVVVLVGFGFWWFRRPKPKRL